MKIFQLRYLGETETNQRLKKLELRLPHFAFKLPPEAAERWTDNKDAELILTIIKYRKVTASLCLVN
jgi:hypothetical protein